jgi:hypothetical protein
MNITSFDRAIRSSRSAAKEYANRDARWPILKLKLKILALKSRFATLP